MAKRLVEYIKNPWRNVFVIVFAFLLYQVNHKYLGLDLLNDNLDRLLNFFPLFLLLLVCINFYFSRKEKKLIVIQALILFFIGLFYLVGSLTWANEVKNNSIGMGAERNVELVFPNYGRDNYLMQEDKFLFFFVKKKCLYSFSPGPLITLEKIDDKTLMIGLTMKSTTNEHEVELVDLTMFSHVYQCEGGSEENVDPYQGIFSYWIRFLGTPFQTSGFSPAK